MNHNINNCLNISNKKYSRARLFFNRSLRTTDILGFSFRKVFFLLAKTLAGFRGILVGRLNPIFESKTEGGRDKEVER